LRGRARSLRRAARAAGEHGRWRRRPALPQGVAQAVSAGGAAAIASTAVRRSCCRSKKPGADGLFTRAFGAQRPTPCDLGWHSRQPRIPHRCACWSAGRSVSGPVAGLPCPASQATLRSAARGHSPAHRSPGGASRRCRDGGAENVLFPGTPSPSRGRAPAFCAAREVGPARSGSQ